MCFSEEASFTSAVVIGIVAGASLHTAGFSRYMPLALATLFFALQQLSEGMTWLHLKGLLQDGSLQFLMRNYYSFFAYVGWPIWVPFCLFIAEKKTWRKDIIGLFLLVGLVLAGYNLSLLINQHPFPVIVNNSIRYETQLPYHEVWVYAAVVLLPWFFSSLPSAFLAGSIFVFSFVIAGFFYEFTFASVWCFFAALVSIVVFKILMDVQEVEEAKNSTSVEKVER
ncbi:putative membrane protein [Chlamydiales bacterium STE3]|nr:putative membrane protein [Chlamydiales bacterium STE3]